MVWFRMKYLEYTLNFYFLFYWTTIDFLFYLFQLFVLLFQKFLLIYPTHSYRQELKVDSLIAVPASNIFKVRRNRNGWIKKTEKSCPMKDSFYISKFYYHLNSPPTLLTTSIAFCITAPICSLVIFPSPIIFICNEIDFLPAGKFSHW